jgi:putative ABC transport system permease protein
MLLRDTVFIAFRALKSNKLRSALTMLGLVIGVAAVIVLVSATQGVRDSVQTAIAATANNITIVPLRPQVPGGPKPQPLDEGDLKALQSAPHVAMLTPVVTGSTVGAAGNVSRAVLVATKDQQFLSATVTGTTANWFTTNNRQLSDGDFFNDTQASSGAHVAVVGSSIARVLFGSSGAAVGQKINVNYRPFTVLGVMKDYGSNLNNNVVVPMTAAKAAVFGFRGSGGQNISQITATATSIQDVPIAQREITRLLDERHHISSPEASDFQIQTLGSRLGTFNQVLSLLTGFAPAIAAVSLLVGGIGVLNIMLVSVTDRTREIGTRKAVGGSDLAILAQFVLEAITLAGVGGLIGVGLGVASIFGMRLAAPLLDKSGGVLSHFYPDLTAPPILVAFGISLMIGVLAGGYPAWRASRLKPIEALRYE